MQVEFLVKLVIWDMCSSSVIVKTTWIVLYVVVFCIIHPGNNISPRQEWFRGELCFHDCFRLGEKVVSPKQWYGRCEKAPGTSVLSTVFSLRQKWPWSRSALWTIFAQAIDFLLGRGVFPPGRNYSRPNLKKKIGFLFHLFNSFEM